MWSSMDEQTKVKRMITFSPTQNLFSVSIDKDGVRNEIKHYNDELTKNEINLAENGQSKTKKKFSCWQNTTYKNHPRK